MLVGITYVYPTNPDATRVLLEEMTARVVLEGHGPRVLIKDFNLLEADCPQAEVWKQHGFLEVQALQQMVSGCPPRNTCKHADFVYVSAEFHALFCRTTVDYTFFPDHAVLHGEFRRQSRPGSSCGKHRRTASLLSLRSVRVVFVLRDRLTRSTSRFGGSMNMGCLMPLLSRASLLRAGRSKAGLQPKKSASHCTFFHSVASPGLRN